MKYNPDFIVMPFDILSDDRLTLRQIRVLMAILSWRKKNTNLSAISREMIAERTGYPLSRISTITSELEALGWLTKQGNGGRSKWIRYQINDLDIDKNEPLNSCQNSNGLNDQERVPETVTVTKSETVTDSDLNGYQNGNETVTESGTRIDTNRITDKDTDKEIYKENSKRKKTIRKKINFGAARFAEFWDAYPPTPRRVAKAKCLEKWKTKNLDEIADQVISHVLEMSKTRQWQSGYEPAPLTYLNQSRWNDGVPEHEACGSGKYAKDIAQMKAMSAWADEQLRKERQNTLEAIE